MPVMTADHMHICDVSGMGRAHPRGCSARRIEMPYVTPTSRPHEARLFIAPASNK